MKWIISLRTIAAVFGLMTLFAGASFAFDKPSHARLPDFDKRAETPKEKELRGQRAAAVERLKQRVPKVKVDLDEVRNTPKFVASTDGFLSGPNGEGRGISSEKVRALPAHDAHRPIKAFLNEHSALYGHGAEALAPARLKRDYTATHNGLRTVVWEQQLDGIAVYEGVMVGHMTRRGELVNLASQFVPDPEQAANAAVPAGANRAVMVAAPAISATQAVLNAASAIGEELVADAVTALGLKAEGPEKRQRFKAPGLPGETEARLIWLPMSEASLRLCWQVDLTRREGGERFRVLIDAQTGEAVLRRCLTVYLSDATYRVFTSDSPTPLSPALPGPSTNQPLSASRSLVTLSALSTNASPLGWIHDGENQTRGNNVDAHSDLNADDLPDLPRPQGSPFRVFDFPIDFTQSPSNYTDAATVQLFYWCNWMHDQLYELGFTEAAGNFQKDNFGRGGLGNDAMQADAQDGSGVNNANYTPAADGTPGRIQMFVFTGPEPDRDGDFDTEVVLHEYTHGLSDRLVGGGVGISQLQAGGMGEGWSDFYALALLSEPGDDLDGTYPEGAYVSFQFFGLTENYYFGIRRYPYSTDLTKNPLTFKDIDPNQIDPHASVPISPLHGFNPLFANEVHNAGEVWCVTLWEMRANLIRTHGFTAGNRLTLQLVTDGMKLSPPNPNFLQARDAIIQADLINSGGQNWNELWAAFAKRGMGFSASSPPSSSTFGIVEAFDLPDALLITPTTAFFSSGPENGPLVPACKTYTLTNHSTFSFTWTANVTQPWLTVSPASGTLAPGKGADVQACLNSAANALPMGSHQDVITFSNLTTGVTQQREVNLRIMRFASMPFVEDFESGIFQPHWMVTGKGDFRSMVTQQSAPHGGLYHLTMDNGGAGDFSRNEVTLGIDLAGFTNVVLRFWAKQFSEEPDGPPTVPFIGGADFDGIAVSSDGVAWYEAQGLRDLRITNSEWVVNLDAVVAAHGLVYGPSFRIRFNQYDNLSVPFDGIAVDDISLTGIPAGRLLLSVPQFATEGDGVLVNQGRVSVVLPAPRNLVVSLTSSDLSKATVPATVTIPAGATQAVFNVEIVNNGLLDGTQPIILGAVAPDFFAHNATMLVHDNDSATLKIMLPRARAREGDPPLMAKLRSNTKPAKDISIRLSSSNTNEAQVPAAVILPARKNSIEFPIMIVDDRRIDGTQTAVIAAHVENWIDDSLAIEIQDNDQPVLSVSLPTSASEGNGVLTNGAQVNLASTWPTDLTVFLRSSDPADLIVPASMTIPAGHFSAPFDLSVVDDSDLEGGQTVTVTASAVGFGAASSSMTIIDDETPPRPYEPDPPDRSTHNPLTANLSWHGGFGEVVVNGGFETGDFRGWQQRNIDFGAFVINDGKRDPEGPDSPLPPFDGNFNAMLEQIGGGRHVLYQDILIPADAKSALLTWADRIRNHSLQFSPGNQEYRVEIRDTSDDVLALAYTTKPGDPPLNDWVERSFDLTSFRGRTIRLAFFEEDHLGYFNLHVDNVSVILGSTATTLFDVYFGTNAMPGPAQFLGTTTNASWDLPTLALDTTYHWRIVSKRGVAQVSGPIWQFTTRGVGEVHHFEWSVIPGTQFVHQPFGVTLTAKDDLNNTVTDFNSAVELTGLPGAGTSSAVVITEIDTGINDRIEFANVSGRRLDISGWQIVLYDSRAWPAPKATFTVPTNTFCPSGALFLLTVPGTAPGAFPLFIAGTNILWNNNVISNHIAVLLRDTASNVVDFMCAVDGNPAQIINPSIPAEEWMGNPVGANTNMTRTFQRVGNIDHNDSTDWVISTNSMGRFHSDMARIFESRLPLSLVPTNVVDFAAGVWNGQLTVGNIIPAMTMLADDGDGHVGIGNVFAVSAMNDLSISIADSPDLAIFGDDVTYSIVVSNTGPAAASGVNMIDNLPENVTLVSVASSQGSCFNLEGDVWCALGTLAAGGSATINIVLTPHRVGAITNTAHVTRIENDAYLPNNTAVAMSTINFPLLSITSPVVLEGNSTTNQIFQVRLSAPSRLPISVDYATADLTATAGEDYIPMAGTLVFPPGTTNQTFAVTVNGDRLDESTEFYAVNLSSPLNSDLLIRLGRGRINDDDPTPNLTISDAMITEGAPGSTTNLTFTVRLSAISGLAASANFTTANRTALATRDYVPKSGVVTFPPGMTNQTITIAVDGDTVYETNETFVVNLSNQANALITDAEGIGTILDNGFVELDHFSWSAIPSPQYAGVPFTVTLTARDGRNNLFPDFSDSVALTAVEESREITIGAGTNIWENPMGTLFHDGRTQIIYLADELGKAGLISALALDVTAIPGQTLSNWTIRIKHTDLAGYAQPSWEGSGWTMVYRQSENLFATGWTTFFFHTPFAYNGTNNLMVDFSFDNSSYTIDGQCRVSATAQSRTVHFRTDSAFGNPLSWVGATAPPPSAIKQVPNLRLLVENPVNLTPAQSGSFAQGTWTGTVLLQDPATNVFLRALHNTGRAGVGNTFAVEPSADTDGDGLPDSWELRYFGSLNDNRAGANADPDNDGLTNLQEFVARTHPMDAGSSVRITSVGWVGGRVRITFSSVAGKIYRVERMDSWGAQWRTVADNIPGTGSDVEIFGRAEGNQNSAFYRVQVLP